MQKKDCPIYNGTGEEGCVHPSYPHQRCIRAPLHTSGQRPEEVQPGDRLFRGGALASGASKTSQGRGRVGLRWKGIEYRHVLMRGDGQCLYRALAFHAKTDWKDMRRILGSAAAACWDEVWPWDQRANLADFLNQVDYCKKFTKSPQCLDYCKR